MTSTPSSRGSLHSNPSTPPRSGSPTPSYLPSSLASSVSNLLRRISTPASSTPTLSSLQTPTSVPHATSKRSDDAFYTPPNRHASPFQPPPLYPLSLRSHHSSSSTSSAILLSCALAEEIRLLIPPRLQLVESWDLAYSLDHDGVSLATLYKKCDELRGVRRGYVLVVKAGDGGIFGAYMTDAPHPSPHYYGTGECFLWRASVLSSTPLLSSLPPPPSTDTTNLQRSTTISASHSQPQNTLSPPATSQANGSASSLSGASTPERIRFKAFPYSGINDYMIFCETGFLSIGGGDGHYGLWLDDVFEKGISSSCPTFGNEPLSDEGEKFDILGVEVWYIGS